MPRIWHNLFLASFVIAALCSLEGCNSLERGRATSVQVPSGNRRSVIAHVSTPIAQPDAMTPQAPAAASDTRQPSAPAIPTDPVPPLTAETMPPAENTPPEYSPDVPPPMPPATMSQWVERQRGKVTVNPEMDSLEVDLANTDVADDGIAQLLPDAGRITKLDLSGTDITDAGLAQLVKLSNLRVLKLNETEVTNKGLELLTALQSLEFLGLASTGATDESLKELANLPQLRYLLLDSNAITDSGLAELQRAKLLEGVSLVETNVTAAGVEKLESAVPQCVVLWREKADGASQNGAAAPMPPMENEARREYRAEPMPAPGVDSGEPVAPAPPVEAAPATSSNLPHIDFNVPWAAPQPPEVDEQEISASPSLSDSDEESPESRSIPFPMSEDVSTHPVDSSADDLPLIVPMFQSQNRSSQPETVDVLDPNVAWSSDQTRFAMVQQSEQSVVLFEAAHAAEGREMQGKVGDCRELRFIDGDRLLVAVTQNTAGLRPAWEAITWNVQTGARVDTLFLGEDVTSVTFVPRTSLVVVARSNRECQLVDITAPHDRAEISAPVTEDLIRRIANQHQNTKR